MAVIARESGGEGIMDKRRVEQEAQRLGFAVTYEPDGKVILNNGAKSEPLKPADALRMLELFSVGM